MVALVNLFGVHLLTIAFRFLVYKYFKGQKRFVYFRLMIEE